MEGTGRHGKEDGEFLVTEHRGADSGCGPSLPLPTKAHITDLYWHSPEVWAQEEKPHELVGVDGNQVTDLPCSHFPHGQVGGRQVHDFIVNLGLEMRAAWFTFVIIIPIITPDATRL